MSEDTQMSGEARKQEEDISADDWASALAEQESVAPASGLAVRAATASNAAPAQPAAQIFQNLSPDNVQPAANNLDLILDIPVQLNVELGRTKIAIRNLPADGCPGERLFDCAGRGRCRQR